MADPPRAEIYNFDFCLLTFDFMFCPMSSSHTPYHTSPTFKSRRSFTLIELLVVIAIVGVLAAFAIAALNGTIIKGRDTRRMSDIKQITNALELALSFDNSYPIPDGNTTVCLSVCAVASPPAWCAGLLAQMSHIPNDPLPNQQCYLYNSDGANFRVAATFEASSNSFLAQNDGGLYSQYFEGQSTPGQVYLTGQKYASVAGGNWSSDSGAWVTSSGGSIIAAHPVAGDIVYLDANSGAVTVDTDSAAATLDLTGYKNTLAIGTKNLTISGNSTITSSGGTATVTIGASAGTGWTTTDMTIGASGVVTCSGNSKITASGNWDSSAGTFTYSTSTVSLTGTGSLKMVSYASFYDLNMAAAGKTTTLLYSGYIYVARVLTLGSGTLSGAGRGIRLQGTGTPLVNNGATITLSTLYYRTSNRGTINVTGGNYTASIIFYPGGGNHTYNISGDLTVTGNIQVRNEYSGATNTINTQNYNITASGLVFSPAGAGLAISVWNLGSSIVDVGTNGVYVDNNGGTHNLNLQTATIANAGLWKMVAGTGTITVVPGTSIVTFDGTGTQNITSNGQSFYNLTVNKSTGSAVLIDTLAATNDLTITTGTLNAAGFGITVGKNWANTGTFTHGNNTVTFNDATKVSTISGTTTFYNFTSTTPNKAIRFTAGTTQTFTSFALTGTAGNLITIDTDTGASTFTLSDGAGTNQIYYTSVTRSTAGGGATWNAFTTDGNVDGGGNSGWVF